MTTIRLQNAEGRIIPDVFIPLAEDVISHVQTAFRELPDCSQDKDQLVKKAAFLTLCEFTSVLDEMFDGALFPDGTTPLGSCMKEVERRLDEANQQTSHQSP